VQGGAARVNRRVPSCYHRKAVRCRSVFSHALERLAVHVALRGEGEATLHERVVYTTAADNSRSTRIRYNALISPLSVGALPWYQPSFSTNSGSSLWCGSSSCSAGWDRTPPSDASRSRHRSHPDASAPTAPKAFAGLTHKPHCALCERDTASPPASPPIPPAPMTPTHRRPRKVDTSMHFCPHGHCDYQGWRGLGNLRANGHPPLWRDHSFLSIT
jgi:hypothetical protein